MKVQLISAPKNAEKLVSCAAKLCYSPLTIDDVMSNITDENANKFVDMLSEIGHESPIEHATFTFGIEGVSRALLAQITRHRIASYSVQSQRYVSEDNFSFVVPPDIESDENAKKLFLEAMQHDIEYYNRITDILKKKHKQKLMNDGIDEKTANRQAEKKSIEDARFVLPNACTTKMILTMNARSLMNFFRLRCCNRAQWEINELACKMLELVSAVAPSIFKYAGPSCVNGFCSEGKMSCGKAKQVREKISKIKSKKSENCDEKTNSN
ncbi:MAG: FAD-dependent thymidylate synthase [Oscillospiraceae bacterium]|nr:FAD-dependent thymidylate synthase [Oscillospiraceae bacterium]